MATADPTSFSKDAREFVDRIPNRIVLVDGGELAKLMLDHDVGVSPVGAYAIKKIDSDYFVEE